METVADQEPTTRPAIVDTKNQWTCEECGTVNTVTTEEDGVTVTMNACSECGAVRPNDEEDVPLVLEDEADDDFNAADLSPDDIAAGLQNLSGGIATAQDVENAARAEEGLPPLPALPFEFTPFNPDNALKTIFDKQADIKLLQEDYEEKKEEASTAKKAFDDGNKELIRLIESFKKQRTQALNPSQPYLAEVTDAPKAAACPWERAHPGQPCPICVEAKRVGLNPAVESPVHPEHEQHDAVAEAARVQNVLTPLRDDLAGVNVFVELLELAGLSTEDLEALKVYVDEPSPMPPQLMARCCIAAEPGSLMQLCKTCEANLLSEPEATAMGEWYPVGALVGFDCKAYVERATDADVQEAAAELETAIDDADKPEPVRTIKARGSKKTAKKQPEAERKAQTEAGRKAAAKAPKAKSTKKAKRK